jgi:DNA-binding Xre family transcriptional regulator
MRANYNRLFKLLIDKRMRKGELIRATGMSGSTLTKLSRGENVNMEVLIRICTVLKCELEDIVQLEPDDTIGKERANHDEKEEN